MYRTRSHPAVLNYLRLTKRHRLEVSAFDKSGVDSSYVNTTMVACSK